MTFVIKKMRTNSFMNQSDMPMEVPFPPGKPEIKPTEEPPVKIWPVKISEIIPGKDPERPKTPNEIPAPPESKN